MKTEELSLRSITRRWNTIPFETLFAFFAIYAGIAGVFKIGTTADALDLVLAPAVVFVFQMMYLASGILMLAGLGAGRRSLEAPGLIFLATSVAIRGIALVGFLGLHAPVFGALVLYVNVLFACGVRIRHLMRNETVIVVKDSHQKIADGS